jgi:hypothetical protein
MAEGVKRKRVTRTYVLLYCVLRFILLCLRLIVLCTYYCIVIIV